MLVTAGNWQDFRVSRLAQQDEVLHDLEAKSNSKVSANYSLVCLCGTRKKVFADPMYGSNRDKIGWKLVAFRELHRRPTPNTWKHGVAYRVEPVSISTCCNSA
jgi:gluconate 2-dehydrogenase gamma chain